MDVFYSLDDVFKEPLAVTLGFFDGVHRGHGHLLENLKREAQVRKLKSLVVTFWPHPRAVVDGNDLLLLQTLEEKIESFKSTGLDGLVVLSFDKQIAQLKAKDFLVKYLLKNLDIRYLLLGYDHGFGSDRLRGLTNYQKIGTECGFTVGQSDPFVVGGKELSSSLIRKCILKGKVRELSEYLGYYYGVKGVVVSGEQLGRRIGFPTANLIFDSHKIIPQEGVYAVRVKIDKSLYGGMLNIGNRPTVNDSQGVTSEVHVFDWQKDLYEKEVRIFFVERMRDEQKFSSLEALKRQLQLDEQQARMIVDEIVRGCVN